MQSPLDLWDALGELPEEELPSLITKLFVTYETMLAKDADNREALNFFTHFANALNQTRDCNLNRR